MKDRDDDWSWNRITPGTGFVNQNTPGLLLSTTVTQVLRPTVVNEMNFGYTHNRWGFKAADDFDYTSLYRSTLGIDPPRFEPFGDYTDPPELSGFGALAGGRVAVCAAIHARAAATVAGPRRAIGTSAADEPHSPPEPERPVRLQRRPVDDEGPPQHQDGRRSSSTTGRPSRAPPTTWGTSISATTRTTR